MTQEQINAAKDGPIKVSRKVKIFPYYSTQLPTEYTQIERKYKIGSAILRIPALSFEEKEMLMPEIIMIAPKNEKFDKEVGIWFDNISQHVPDEGHELEIGFRYSTEELKRAGEAADITERTKFGYPMKTSDYVLYRYCLVYGRVANDISEVQKSPKIRFYMRDEFKEKQAVNQKSEMRLKSYAKFIEINNDAELLQNIATAINQGEDPDLVISQVENFCNTDPKRFLELASNPKLPMISLVNKCLRFGVLSKLDKSEIVMFDDTRVGVSIPDTVNTLLDSRNESLLERIKAKLEVKPLSKVTIPTPGIQVNLKDTAEYQKLVDQKIEQAGAESVKILGDAKLGADEIIKKAIEEADKIKLAAQNQAKIPATK